MLFAFPDGTWAVDLPAEEVPPEVPEPALGINFARKDSTVFPHASQTAAQGQQQGLRVFGAFSSGRRGRHAEA